MFQSWLITKHFTIFKGIGGSDPKFWSWLNLMELILLNSELFTECKNSKYFLRYRVKRLDQYKNDTHFGIAIILFQLIFHKNGCLNNRNKSLSLSCSSSGRWALFLFHVNYYRRAGSGVIRINYWSSIAAADIVQNGTCHKYFGYFTGEITQSATCMIKNPPSAFEYAKSSLN